MRTKTLLIAAAALAAGILASSAQTYSQNIVGYVNFVSTTVSPQYQMIDNPLDNGTNTIASLFPTPTGGTKIYLWQPLAGNYLIANFSGGHWKTNGVTVDNTLMIPPGVGFFIQIGSGILTNTFVGTVVPNTGLNMTNVLGTGTYAVSSMLPISDSVTNTGTINFSMPGGSLFEKWNVAGQQYDIYSIVGGKWRLNGIANSPPVVNLPEGFIIVNNSGSPINWVQTGP
jgi:hypothetical protein